MSPAKANSARRAQAILDAALKLIVHYGYDKTTMDDIAREAGVSKGALYLHWRSKDALFDALVMRESDAVIDVMMAAVESDPNGGSLFGIYRHAIMASFNNPLIRALYTRDNRVLGEYVRSWRSDKHLAQGVTLSREFIEHFQQAGLIRSELKPDAVLYLLSIVRSGLMASADLFPDVPPPLDDLGDLIAEMLEGVLAPAGGDSEAGKRFFAQYLEGMRAVMESRRLEREAEQNDKQK